jgi:hypothetical protein
VTVVSGVVLATAAGLMAVSAGVLILATGAAAVAVGALAVVAAGTLAGSAGVLTVALGAAAGAAAAAAQWSEIMFTSVTAKPLSAAAGSNPFALFPMTFTAWPRCGLRSTLLVVILKMWPVLSSTTV